MTSLTDRQVKSALTSTKTGTRWLTESLGRGSGSLVLKTSGGSGSWYFRYAVDRKSYYWPIGPFGEDPAYTLKRARVEAQRLAAECRSLADGNLHAARERQRQEEEARRQAEEEARQKALQAPQHTLGALLDLYIAYLEKQGKDARGPRSSLNHVKRSELAALAAKEVTRPQITALIRSIVEDGKGRQAGKVRAYLHAAYALAVRSEGDATAPSALVSFEVSHNPVSGTASLSQFIKPRDRTLSEAELREFWKRLQKIEGIAADAIKVQVLTGGQRWQQLLRATVDDFDEAGATLTLKDTKGRRQQPRAHVVPLVPDALAILKERAKIARELGSPWLFTTDGETHVAESTPAQVLRGIRDTMLADGTASGPFLPSDMRRTAETLMASLGISKDVRAQVQSHGLSGIQHRHYDRYSYHDEKLNALKAWSTWLTTGKRASNVVELKRESA